MLSYVFIIIIITMSFTFSNDNGWLVNKVFGILDELWLLPLLLHFFIETETCRLECELCLLSSV